MTPPFVLVHGSGGGAWSWDPVAPILERAGHEVLAPTLPGMDHPRTTLADHVRAVVDLLEERDLRDVVLVGHSYGGMPITGAAEHVPARLRRLVYLDAFVPEDGQCAFDTRPDLAATLGASAVAGLVPPIDPRFAGIETEEQAQMLRARLTTTPLRVLTDPISLDDRRAAGVPRTFIFCTRSGFGGIAARARGLGWDYRELDTPHMAQLTAPEELAELLLTVARIPSSDLGPRR